MSKPPSALRASYAHIDRPSLMAANIIVARTLATASAVVYVAAVTIVLRITALLLPCVWSLSCVATARTSRITTCFRRNTIWRAHAVISKLPVCIIPDCIASVHVTHTTIAPLAVGWILNVSSVLAAVSVASSAARALVKPQSSFALSLSMTQKSTIASMVSNTMRRSSS